MREALCKVSLTVIKILATIKFQDFKKILEEEFKSAKPADTLVTYMFERFRKFKFND